MTKLFKKIVWFVLALAEKRIIFIPDKIYIMIAYKYHLGKNINLKNPKSFNEKLNWLKLYDRKKIYSKMVDKSEAKEYVASMIGDEHIIPTIGIFEKFDDINFDKLPNEFVIKTTHDSGCCEIVKNKNKININKLKKKMTKSLGRNYYYFAREWPYKYVKPRIIIEKCMKCKSGESINDYKFFCFNGQAKFFKIDFDRTTYHRANYYDINGKLLDFGEAICPPDYNRTVMLPHKLNEMIEYANTLSNGTKFLRVDFYEIDGIVYFGELTFFPAGGFGKFVPDKYDMLLGNYLIIEGKEK